MVRTACRIGEEADIVATWWTTVRWGKAPRMPWFADPKRFPVPRILVVNKVDRIGRAAADEVRTSLTRDDFYAASFLVSATKGDGVEALLTALFARFARGAGVLPRRGPDRPRCASSPRR